MTTSERSKGQEMNDRTNPAEGKRNEAGADVSGAYTYSSVQATNCARCGNYKHTPLRIDWMGGYVCLTCIDRELESRSPAMVVERFIVIGHGESDIPEAKIVACRADVLDAVLGTIYGGQCNDDAMRTEYASMLAGWDGDHWEVAFEIGSIQVWRIALSDAPAMAAEAAALYQYRTRPDWKDQWSEWEECSAAAAADYIRVPRLHDWHYEVRALYTTPQPSARALQPEPGAELPRFPVVLRKMWSGGEVQRWIDENIAPRVPLRDAVCDVLAERRRQVDVEGWTPEHDDEYTNNELARASACYAYPELTAVDGLRAWPWPGQWWKPSAPRRNLVKAVALGIAEIERLDRAAARAGESR
ncbi:hypothetical protein LFL97_33960 [Burkholderia sp. JSH-S8]|nr:hypothetical protein LFL97_33960 [Burkholderia sp. JSH-S8]